MKKKILFFIVLACVVLFSATSNSIISTNPKLNFIEIANACTATVECSNNQTIQCGGVSSCEAGPGWVKCDGTCMAFCD